MNLLLQEFGKGSSFCSHMDLSFCDQKKPCDRIKSPFRFAEFRAFMVHLGLARSGWRKAAKKTTQCGKQLEDLVEELKECFFGRCCAGSVSTRTVSSTLGESDEGLVSTIL